MEFEKEKLSLSAILIITGTSCLLFTGIIRVLDGAANTLFLKIGIGCLVAVTGLQFLKLVATQLSPARKRTEKAP